jgi:hypothetical protein
MAFRYATLVLLLSVATSCHKSSSSSPVTPSSDCGPYTPYAHITVPLDTTCATVVLDSFPLSAGHRWTYFVEEQGTNFCGQVYHDTFSFSIEILSDTVINGTHFAESYNSFSNRHGDWDIPSLFFCVPATTGYFFNFSNGLHQWQDRSHTDSIYLADSTSLITSRLSDGTSWTSKEYIDAVKTVTVQRKWIGNFAIATPAGTFNCHKLDVQFNGNGNGGVSHQYYSSKGLVAVIQQGSASSMGPGEGATILTKVITLTSVNF